MGTRKDGKKRNRGRDLIADSVNVDWAAAGNNTLTPVKNQGSCGSCWAFTATTVIESTLAIKAGTKPSRLSEQQLLDCTTNTKDNLEMFGKTYKTFGCRGGWMPYAYKFYKENGIMSYEDYPYSSTEQKCQHDNSKTIGSIGSWGQITENIDRVKLKLQEQPLTVAMDASSAAWRYYNSGIIDADDECGESLNHAVVIVGYTEVGASPPPGPEPTDGDGDGSTPVPTPEPTPEPTPKDEDEDGEICSVTKWWRNCTTPDNGRRLADTQGDEGYWKVQNSWGTSWGD